MSLIRATTNLFHSPFSGMIPVSWHQNNQSFWIFIRPLAGIAHSHTHADPVLKFTGYFANRQIHRNDTLKVKK